MEVRVKNFEKAIIRSDYSYRGGGIEIDLTEFGFKGQKMTAFCNYLGGDMIGRVCSSNTINKETMYREKYLQEDIDNIADELKMYFFGLIVGDFNGSDWLNNQALPISAY
jgi:hypothetical protein